MARIAAKPKALTRQGAPRAIRKYLLPADIPPAHALVLAGIVLFYIVQNAIWLQADAPFPMGGRYLSNLADLYQCFTASDHGIFHCLNNAQYQPLYQLHAIALLSVLGKSFWKMILALNIPYFILLVGSLYALGRHIADSRVGLASALLVSLYPAVFGTSRMFLPQFPLMAIAVFSVWALLKSDGFLNRPYVLLFGIAVGCGLLVKMDFAAFMAGPVLCVLLSEALAVLRSPGKWIHPRRLSNLLISFGIGLLITLPLLHPIKFYWWVGSLFLEERSGMETLHFWKSQVSLVFFVVFLVGSVSFFFQRRIPMAVKTVLYSWILLPLIGLSVMTHYATAFYNLASLPAVALVSAIGLNGKSVAWWRVKLGVLLIFGLIQHYDLSFAGGPRLETASLRLFKTDFPLVVRNPEICRRAESQEKQMRLFRKVNVVLLDRLKNHPGEGILFWPLGRSGEYGPYSALTWGVMHLFEDLPFDVQFPEFYLPNLFESVHAHDLILVAGSPEEVDIKNGSAFSREYAAVMRRFMWEGYSLSKGASMHQYMTQQGFENLETRYVELMKDFRGSKIGEENGLVVYLYERHRGDDS